MFLILFWHPTTDILQANVKEFENVSIELPEEDREDRELAINDDVIQSVPV